MEWLTILMLEKPKTISWWGKVLFYAGGLATIVGLWGVLALPAIAVPTKLANVGAATRSLADAYPAYPTWWIPESVAGFVVSIGVAALGVWLVMATKHLNRTFR
ncbi:hypothetical protein [Variovorax sp. RB2P76]|uniref:hypothetical protein n=1 Tax=Variovorax sp. RB2P76 TaxID=3443736 RepID=UPI003F495E6F